MQACCCDIVSTQSVTQMLRAPTNGYQAEQLSSIPNKYVITFTDRGMANVNDDVSFSRAHAPISALKPS